MEETKTHISCGAKDRGSIVKECNSKKDITMSNKKVQNIITKNHNLKRQEAQLSDSLYRSLSSYVRQNSFQKIK